MIKNIIDEHFREHNENAMREPLLYGDYRTALDGGEARLYEDIQDYDAAKALFQEVNFCLTYLCMYLFVYVFVCYVVDFTSFFFSVHIMVHHIIKYGQDQNKQIIAVNLKLPSLFILFVDFIYFSFFSHYNRSHYKVWSKLEQTRDSSKLKNAFPF